MKVDFQSTRKEGRGSGNVALKYSHPCGTQKIGADPFHMRVPEARLFQEDGGVIEAGDWLLTRGPAVVLVTDGEHGMLLHTASAARFRSTGAGAGGSVLSQLPESWHDRRVLAPTVADAVVQTTGAGDAASAGLLAALHHGLQLDDAVALVLSAAAHRVAGRGSLSGLAHPSVSR